MQRLMNALLFTLIGLVLGMKLAEANYRPPVLPPAPVTYSIVMDESCYRQLVSSDLVQIKIIK